MQSKRTLTGWKIGAGVFIWAGALVAAANAWNSEDSRIGDVAKQVGGYLASRRQQIDIVSPEFVVLGVGDPVFMEVNGQSRPIGVVCKLDFPPEESPGPVRLAWVQRATVECYAGMPPLGEGDFMALHQTDASVGWVMQTMLSPAMRNEIRSLITTAWDRHQSVLIEQFRPVLEQTVMDSAKLVREDLAKQIELRRDDIAALGQRYQDDVLEKEIVPLIREEIWPIVQERSTPLVEKIGREIWSEFSLWRFGWRYIYDRTPLPDRNLAGREFDRFLSDKAIPVIESHLDEIVDLQKDLVSEIAANERLRSAMSGAARTMVDDPEVRDLIREIFDAVIVNNRRLRDSVEQTWKTQAARDALASANSRLEPTITAIGQTLFGSPQGEITPEFARVLRNRVLHKDDRWLTLHSNRAVGSVEEDGPDASNSDASQLTQRHWETVKYFQEEEGALPVCIPMVISQQDREIPMQSISDASNDRHNGGPVPKGRPQPGEDKQKTSDRPAETDGA